MICEILAMTVTLHSPGVGMATLECQDGRVLSTRVITGGPQTPTPTGVFRVYDVAPQGEPGYLPGMACFQPYRLGVDGNDKKAVGSEFCAHRNSPELPQRWSLGCIRLPAKLWPKTRFRVGSMIRIAPASRY